MPRSKEQKLYAKAYNAFNAAVFANKNYQPNAELQSDEVYHKETQELIKLYDDLTSQSDSKFNLGLRELVT